MMITNTKILSHDFVLNLTDEDTIHIPSLIGQYQYNFLSLLLAQNPKARFVEDPISNSLVNKCYKGQCSLTKDETEYLLKVLEHSEKVFSSDPSLLPIRIMFNDKYFSERGKVILTQLRNLSQVNLDIELFKKAS